METKENKSYGKDVEVKSKEIDFRALLMSFLRRWWLIVLAAAIVGGCFYAYSRLVIKPTYRSYFTAYVNNKNYDDTEKLSSSDIQASKNLAQTYARIIKSNKMIEAANNYLGADADSHLKSNMISVIIQGETEIFAVYVEAYSKQEAFDFAMALASVAPDNMADIIEGSSMKIVDYPERPGDKYSPNNGRNALMGAVIGAVIMLAILTIVFFSDDAVKDEKELERRFPLPILGVVPDFNSAKEHSTSYYYYQSYGKNRKVNEEGKDNG